MIRELPDGRRWNGLAYVHDSAVVGCDCGSCKGWFASDKGERGHQAVDVFNTMIRKVCPIGGNPDEIGIRLGNVEFWIDDTGPWANQLSFSVPTSQWDVKRLSEDLTRALKGQP